ncbi:DUF4034 domain-containing protein [Paraburkholderia dinghuensis]|uniref:DUF4034 domain-containing protein n=1 Tax=Paraburkholderia dinghuensis TaxID=2305225 RepID=A0A3N6MRE3_9BURK|nr:DUF4034 domain-containing protein [Paraburkholderia dinghuensis]
MHALKSGPAVLEQLLLWSEAHPSSSFPGMLEVAYWSAWFGEYRGGSMADEVTDAMWSCCGFAQDAMFCALFRLLQKDAHAWLSARAVLYSVAAVGEPGWCSAWLLQGERPESIPARRVSGDLAALRGRSGGQTFNQSLPDMLSGVLTGDALSWRRDPATEITVDEGAVPLQYWLRVAFAMDPFALEAAARYVFLRMPRWGGSIKEMLEFVDQPLCARFDEIERNVLRFVAWYDEMEVDGYLLEDERVVRNQLKIGEALAKRPLPDNLRGRVHKYIAYLLAKLGRFDEAGKHYVVSAPHNHLQEWEIVRAVATWVASSERGPWLGQIAATNRLVNSPAAALYGFLCSQGWAGVEKRPEVAEGWYRRAAELTPDLSYTGFSPFKCIDDLRNIEGDQPFLPMWLRAADYGDASSQFLCGCYFDDEGNDHDRAIQYFRQAAANGHIVAMINLVSGQLKGVLNNTITGNQAGEAARDALRHLDTAVNLLRSQDELDDFSQDILSRLEGAHGWVLSNRGFPRFARLHVLPRTIEIARSGHVGAMQALGWWYGEKNTEHYNYKEAVRWTEAARHADPDDEDLESLLDAIRGKSLWRGARYRFMQRTIKREGLPGQPNV